MAKSVESLFKEADELLSPTKGLSLSTDTTKIESAQATSANQGAKVPLSRLKNASTAQGSVHLPPSGKGAGSRTPAGRGQVPVPVIIPGQLLQNL